MNSHDKLLAGSALAACCTLLAWQARAQPNEAVLGPGLAEDLPYANAIEQAAAGANDALYRTLDEHCNPFGVLNQSPSPQFSDIQGEPGSPVQPGPLCTQETFHTYVNARELAHSANALQGEGPTAASLGLDHSELGAALRWTAAEELAAQGSMATEFANGQLSSLAARLSALRFGAGGFRAAGNYELLRRSSPLLAQAGGGSEPAPDETGERYSPWGGFVNYGFGYGDKAPTPREDAFEFDGSEVTLGVDYRFGNGIVLGGIVGLSEQDIDFDETASAISVVDGDIDADGSSVMLFAMSQGERLTISGSVGRQSMDYEVERHIRYPSFNPAISSVNSVARSTPEADIDTMTFGFGYAFTWNKLTLEPYMDVERLDVSIGSFAEQRSVNLLGGGASSRRFDLAVSGQDIDSLETSVGVRFQFVLTPPLGVVVPYWSIAAHREHRDDVRTIASGYAALEDVPGGGTFALPTDPPDESYYTLSAGVSLVVRGGRQREAGGPIAGGLMAFFQYGTVENLRHYDDQVITGGLRYEF